MAETLKRTGGRQVGSSLDEIRVDHRNRYLWVKDKLTVKDWVIDAGCGVGYGSQILLEACRQVSSYDISQEAINYADKHWKKSNVSFTRCDLHFLEVEAGSVDKVVAFEVIEHLAFPELFINRAQRCLKSGGGFYVSVPNQDKIAHSIPLNPFHFKHYKFDEIVELCSRNGFKLKEYLYQDYEELFEDKTGKFILLEFIKSEESSQPLVKLDVENMMSFFTNEVHERSESIALLNKELKAKSKQSEDRAGIIRELKLEIESEKKKKDIALAKLSALEQYYSSLLKLTTANSQERESQSNRILLEKDDEILRLTAEKAKYKTIAEESFSKAKSDFNSTILKERNNYEKQIVNLEGSLKNEQERFSSAQSLLTQQIENLKENIVALKASYSSREAFLTEKVEQSEEELNSYRRQYLIEEKEQQEKIQKLEKEIIASKEECSILSSELKLIISQSKESLISEQEKYDAMENRLSEKNRELKETLEVEQHRIRKLELDLEAKENLLLEATKQLEISRSDNSSKALKIHDVEFVSKYWEKEAKSKTHILQNHSATILRLEKKVKEQNDFRKDLTRKNDVLLEENGALLRMYESLIKKTESYKNECEFLTSKLNRASNHIEKQDKKEAAAKAKVVKLREEVKIIEKKYAQKLDKAHSEIQKYSNMIPMALNKALTHGAFINSDQSFFERIKCYLREVKLKRIVRNSELFDADWYLNKYKSVTISGLSPELHFLRVGAVLGYLPSERFDTQKYFSDYEDLDVLDTNPIVHFELFGRGENRVISPLK